MKRCFFIGAIMTFGTFFGGMESHAAACQRTNFKDLDQAIEAFRKQGNITGAQITIKTPHYTFSRKYGRKSRDAEWAKKDLLRIASVSKTFIAALVLKMAERTGLSIDDPIAKYLPGELLPKANFEKVRVSDLLRHSSGIPDYFTKQFINLILRKPQVQRTEVEALAAVRHLPMEFEPGASIKYSNTNYILLGLILDVVGRRLNIGGHHVLLREMILNPLRLPSTFYEHKESNRYDEGQIAHGYLNGRDYTSVEQGYGLANGGLLSSTIDVANFYHAMFVDPRWNYVGKRMRPTQNANYGFGGYYLGSKREFIGHTGEFAGYLSVVAHSDARNATIAVFVNDSSQKAKEAMKSVQTYLFETYCY